MRVLIYGEGPEATAIQAREREAGHLASLRNPDLQLFAIDNPEPCDKVWTNQDWIAEAYAAKGVEVWNIDAELKSAEPADEKPSDGEAAKPAPRKKGRK